ncbi:MAG: MGDG synthase family glycosyltransferase [Chloroflexota bacterium]
MTKRIVFLMSDTGGGHRSAAEAIRDAMYLKYGRSNLDVTLVDVFRQCRWPLNKMPEFYPWIVNNSATLWGVGYRIANIRPVYAINKRSIYLSNRDRLKSMVQEHPADVVVSVHSVITQPSLYAYEAFNHRPPFITVVTDLVSTPRYWYDHRADFTFLPTDTAYQRGIANGMNPARMRVVGLPVHPRFNNLREPQEVRREFGWDESLPTIMLVAGGDGMGPLYETALAINRRQLRCQLVIVAGKNAALKNRLEAVEWHQPTHIYGFVRDMPDKMRGADILVTKAGPATISEAFTVGLPVIISDMIPGQEVGNVQHVVGNDAGVFANSPQKVADAVAEWLSDDAEGLAWRKENARRLANPDAVWEIAQAVWQYAHHPPVFTGR